MSKQLTLGIEEEAMLVDQGTKAALPEPRAELVRSLSSLMGASYSPELHPALAEIKTPPCANIKQLDVALAKVRKKLVSVTRAHGVEPIFISSHPFSPWYQQRLQGYEYLRDDLQSVGSRFFVGGMHIHVGIDDPDLRVILQNHLVDYLPLFLSLSTSSAFWCSRLTGLMSYRSVIIDSLPRSGVPPYFSNYQQYISYLDTLIKSKMIDNERRCWWHIRPNITYPTLELRICDVCLEQRHAVSIAALYQCLVYYLKGQISDNGICNRNPHLQNNLWQARRYSFNGLFVDKLNQAFKISEVIQTLINKLAPIARTLDCYDELNAVHNIISNGTLSHQLIAAFSRLEGTQGSPMLVFQQLLCELNSDQYVPNYA